MKTQTRNCPLAIPPPRSPLKAATNPGPSHAATKRVVEDVADLSALVRWRRAAVALARVLT